MKYEDFDGPVEELVRMKLKEIEEKESITVLHAVESGSRAWGFASPDSDYDVRFIYKRKLEDYLRLESLKDTIDWELNEVLDINGWDIRKAMQHLHKSNATVFEWANSPVVYYSTDEWKQLYEQCAGGYFSCKSALYHYYATARKTYVEHLTGDQVRYKKYFYALRPILACRWIEKKQTPPPVLFDDLCKEVLEEEMQPVVRDLIAKKVKMSESDKASKVTLVNEYLERNLDYYKNLAESMEDDKNPDWEQLDQVFLHMMGI